MVRAAIATDTTTLRDMAATGSMLKPGERQVVELFQWRGDRPSSLLRLPAAAPPLAAIRAGETKLAAAGGELLAVTGAPVVPLYRSVGVEGSLSISSQIDLKPIRDRLAPKVERAWIAGAGLQVPLVGPSGGPGATGVAVPLPGDEKLPPISLEAVSRRSAAGWTGPAAAGCGAVGALLLALLLVERRRARRLAQQ
jgi:hypothetical protein